jgi:hypothetical protein
MKDRLESLIRGQIARGDDFFERHKGFFPQEGHCNPDFAKDAPETYEEADSIRKILNQSTKQLIIQGGRLPSVIGDVTRIHEKIGLILSGEEFFTQTETLADGRFSQEGMKVSWLALRSALTRRAVEGTLIRKKRVITIDDLIHLVFEDGSSENSGDLGWVNTDITNSQIQDSYKTADDQRIHRKRVEGLVWRHFRLGEAARAPNREMEEDNQITLISEMRTEQGLNRGLRPVFNSEPPISFGSIDIGGYNFEIEKEKARKEIRGQIERARAWIVRQIRQEIAMTDPNRFRGGRPNTNPSALYHFPDYRR